MNVKQASFSRIGVQITKMVEFVIHLPILNSIKYKILKKNVTSKKKIKPLFLNIKVTKLTCTNNTALAELSCTILHKTFPYYKFTLGGKKYPLEIFQENLGIQDIFRTSFNAN